MKVFFRKFVWLFAFILCSIVSGLSQGGVLLNTELDNHSILIGDQVMLHFEVKQEKSEELLTVNFPYFETQLTEKIEIINSSFDTLESEEGTEVIQYNLLITSFEEGNHYIPPFPFVIQNGELNDTIFSVETYLEVGGVAIDTTNAIRDIKAIEKAPLTFREIIPWFSILILIGLIIGFIALYLEKKKAKESDEPEDKRPAEPAHIIALRELDLLKAQKLWQQNEVKEYYSRLTGIIRKYIELQFVIPALEQTTTEILKSFHVSGYRSKINYNEMEELLNLADMVKFAKGEPNPRENEKLLDVAYKFVRDTKDTFNENDNQTDAN